MINITEKKKTWWGLTQAKKNENHESNFHWYPHTTAPFLAGTNHKLLFWWDLCYAGRSSLWYTMFNFTGYFQTELFTNGF